MPFQFRKEAIEEDLNKNFPSQGQGNPPLYYSLSEVVVPTYNINSVTEGSGLPVNLQTALDFSTGHAQVSNTTTTLVNNPGFWQVDLTASFRNRTATDVVCSVNISDGLTSKVIWRQLVRATTSAVDVGFTDDKFVVFLRSGDTLTATSNDGNGFLNVWWRQIATVNGTLVNPLGFSFA